MPDQLQIGDGFIELQLHANLAVFEYEDFAGDAIHHLYGATGPCGGRFCERGGKNPRRFSDCQSVPFGKGTSAADTVLQGLSGIAEDGRVLQLGFIPGHADLFEPTVLSLQFECDLLRASSWFGSTPARSGSKGDIGADGGDLLWQSDFKPKIRGSGQIGEGSQQSPCQKL